MNETLFIQSPITLVLSLVAIILAASYSTMMGQKTKVSSLPFAVRYLVITIIAWNLLAFVGTLFFSGSHPGLGGQIVFGLQAMIWIQAGNTIYKVAQLNLHSKSNLLWNIFNIFGVVLAAVSTAILCLHPALITDFSLFGHQPFAHRPNFVLFSIFFFIFVFPELLRSIFVLLRNALRTSDQAQSQISIYMTGALAFFVIIPLLFDFFIPFVQRGQTSHFMLWYQFSYLFLTIICGQYYTSISFRNKSASWFLDKLRKDVGDCYFSFDNDGNILTANPAAETLFRMTESDMQKKKIQDLLPGLDIKREGTKSNVNVKILNEQHSFNMSVYRIQKSLTTFTNVLLLSDQSNSLLYKQRIESLNAQFAEYKQDLLRYQDRLDSSQKKSNENESFLNTLINALPFQFWAKNEHGVYMAQNQRDLQKRGNLFHTTDNAESISSYELEAREKGNPNSHTSYELLDGGEISEDEANVQINDGKFVSIFENMFIPILSKHSPYKVIGIKIDMTDQKRVERERNILQEQKNIHSRLEELGTLCGAFAHDYNNILGSQIGFCQLASEMLGAIQSEEVDDGIKKKVLTAGNFVAEATKAAQRGKVSLEELLNTIQGQAKSSGDVIVFAPYMIIDDVKKKLSLTLPPNISISSSKMDKSIRISGIPSALDRIISNLSNNALFAMKEMGGTLTFGLEKESLVHQLITPYAPPIPPGNYAKFTIADTGTGMDSNTLERIFSPFFTTKAPGEGLGLGLSSALRLLKEGNAYLTVQTRLGEGTIFNLYWSLYNESQGEQNVHSSNY